MEGSQSVDEHTIDFMKREILVIDDTPENHQLIDQALSKDMYYIHHAVSADAGLATLRKSADICLMIVDVQMPECDGFEFAKRYYAEFRGNEIPIIFISAHKTKERDLFHGHKLGAYDYLVRPFYPPLLQEKVRNLTELSLSRAYLKKHVELLTENNRVLLGLKDKLLKQLAESSLQKSELLQSRMMLEQQIEFLQGQVESLTNQLKFIDKS